MQDQKTEQFLDRGQWAWEYRARVDFREIDLKRSDENPARNNRKLDEARATQYGCDMIDGVKFPAIVLLNIDLAEVSASTVLKWLVATGMHRIRGAMEAGIDYFDAYVVSEADVYRREVLVRQLNSIEGRGMTIGEQLDHVLWLKKMFPDKSLQELSKSWSIKQATLTNAWNEDKARARARAFHVDFERIKLPQKSALALGSIHSDIVFEKAAEFVNNVSGTTAGEIKDMVAEIKRQRDEKSQLAVVKKYRDAAEDRLRRAAARTARTQPTRVNRLISDERRTNRHFNRPMDELHVAALDSKGRTDALMISKDLIENLKRFVVELERVDRMVAPTVGMRTGFRPEIHL